MEESSAIAAAAASRARFERGERFPPSESEKTERVRARATLVVTGITVVLTTLWAVAVLERWVGFTAKDPKWYFQTSHAVLLAGGVTLSVAIVATLLGRRLRNARPTRRTTVMMAWVAAALALAIVAPQSQRPFGRYSTWTTELPAVSSTTRWLLTTFVLGAACSLVAAWFVSSGTRGPLGAGALALLSTAWIARGSGLTGPHYKWEERRPRSYSLSEYASPSISPWLLAGGLVLVALAGLAVVLGRRSRENAIRGAYALVVLFLCQIGLVVFQLTRDPELIGIVAVDGL